MCPRVSPAPFVYCIAPCTHTRTSRSCTAAKVLRAALCMEIQFQPPELNFRGLLLICLILNLEFSGVALRLGFIDVKVIATNHGKQFSLSWFQPAYAKGFRLSGMRHMLGHFSSLWYSSLCVPLASCYRLIGKQVTITTGKPNMVSVA